MAIPALTERWTPTTMPVTITMARTIERGQVAEQADRPKDDRGRGTDRSGAEAEGMSVAVTDACVASVG
jgi:hypothetical protein